MDEVKKGLWDFLDDWALILLKGMDKKTTLSGKIQNKKFTLEAYLEGRKVKSF